MWWFLACAEPERALSRPNRVAVGPDGTVYVSDLQHDRVVAFDASGAPVGQLGEQGLGRGQLWRVTALAVGQDGSVLVANRRPSDAQAGHDVQFELVRFLDGDEVDRVVLDGVIGADGWVDAVVETAAGTWVVADSAHGALHEIDREGRPMGRFGGLLGADAAPSSLVRDGFALWAVEQNRHRVRVLTADGSDVAFPFDDQGHGPPRFPSALALCPGRWVAVADLANHRVQRYDRDGAWLGEFSPADVAPDRPAQLVDVAVSRNCGQLYVVDSKGDRVLVTDPDGALLHTLDRW